MPAGDRPGGSPSISRNSGVTLGVLHECFKTVFAAERVFHAPVRRFEICGRRIYGHAADRVRRLPRSRFCRCRLVSVGSFFHKFPPWGCASETSPPMRFRENASKPNVFSLESNPPGEQYTLRTRRCHRTKAVVGQSVQGPGQMERRRERPQSIPPRHRAGPARAASNFSLRRGGRPARQLRP